MSMSKMTAAWALLFTLLGSAAAPQAPAAEATTERDWVARSDAHSEVLLEVLARFAPELAATFGAEGLDEEITQLPADFNQRVLEALEDALEVLRPRLAEETHPAVRQDLEILIRATERLIEEVHLDEQYTLPYFDLPVLFFRGIRAVLNDQAAAERRPAALKRLKRYAGLEEGYTPLAVQAEAFIRGWFDEPGLQGPFKEEVEKSLATGHRLMAGIEQLFEGYELKGYEEAYAALQEQVAAYEEFVRKEVLPRARQDFRLAPEVYAFALQEVGVDMPVDELMSRAKVAFREIQNEMQVLAALVAEERGLPSADYRDVIRALKKEQVVGEAILPLYRQRLEAIEAIVRREGIVTLPEREMIIRLATEAESAETPAPHLDPPRLLGNTGEMGEMVVPLRIPDATGEGEMAFDDFTYDAVSWSLVVHEGRPGHELQFASLVEKGVSKARALFAFNSVNAEGWALYMEAEMKPYLPLEAQLVSLQYRLLRAARAILDPGLQRGTITRDEAFRILEEEVVMSKAAALEEVERFTFRNPGQATAYFCGYSRLMELRADVERILGDRFDRRAFHDFLLAQGLLPPALLRRAVMEELVPRMGG